MCILNDRFRFIKVIKLAKNDDFLKTILMMSVEFIVVVFNGFFSLELIYLANYAKINFQLLSIYFI